MKGGITANELLKLSWFIVFLLTLVHVYRESKRLNDFPIRNTLLVALCVWPLGYLFWIFYWPGTFWRKLIGRKQREPVLPVKFNRAEESK